MSDTLSLKSTISAANLEVVQHNEGYFELVWRRFRRSKASIVGGLMVITLGFLAIFAEFFAPYSLSKSISMMLLSRRSASALLMQRATSTCVPLYTISGWKSA
jgi:hypothetical protein